MVDLKMITARQRAGVAGPSAGGGQDRAGAPYYLAHIRSKLIERYGAEIIEQGGLEVTAAMDLNLQKQAEQALRDGVKRISPELQGALICLDPATGDVLAAVGGVDGGQSSYQPRLLCQAPARLGHQAADLCRGPGKGVYGRQHLE